MTFVHYCDWSSQPGIHIACDDSWTTPDWKSATSSGAYTDKPNVYRADNGYLYTFERDLVTCPACLLWLEER